MYSVTSANAVSSLNTPYAISNGPLGYGDCGQKIRSDYGPRAIPAYLAQPQNAYWSPTPSDADAHITLSQFSNPNPLVQGTGILLPRPDPDTYPLATSENFSLGQLEGVDCGMYACGPNMPVYATYENYAHKSTEYNEPSWFMTALCVAFIVGAIVYMARR